MRNICKTCGYYTDNPKDTFYKCYTSQCPAYERDFKNVFPSENVWMNFDTREPHPVYKAYRSQLIAVILNSGKFKVYDGENGMNECYYINHEEVKTWFIDKNLTRIFRANFPQVKEIRVADL